MAAKPKALLLFVAVLALSTTLALCDQERGVDNSRDPEQRLQQCRQQCQQQQRGQQQRMQCERRCQEQYQQEKQQQGETGQDSSRDPARRRLEECKHQCTYQHHHDEQQRRQCESRCEAQYEEERRGQRDVAVDEVNKKDPEQRYKECRQDCRRRGQDERQQQQCAQRCEEQYKEERRRQGNHHREEEEEWTEEKNPYLFGRESFYEPMKTGHGRVRILQNFLENSKLLLGIANYRIVIVEAKPHAFVMPHHVDADVVSYVAKGCGAVTLICQDKKESYELQQGDIFNVPAGAIVYMINKDRNENLVLINLLQPVFTPGRFEAFHGVGGRDPESFLRSFSDEILEAAYNTRRDRMEKLWGQKGGAIVEASEEQIRALSRHTSEGGQWPFGQSKGPFNLLKKRPTHSSRRGQLHEVGVNDYPPLRHLDIQISYANLSEGSMTAPYYNSRATKIAVIVEGTGYIETVCPHISKQRQSREKEGEGKGRREGGGKSYQRVRSEVSPGTVVVIPAGHPTVTVASRGKNFEAVCFEICAERNVKNFLAGKNNVFKQLDREAKELSFNMPAREVDEVLTAQDEQIIVAGPEERERRHRPLLPMLEFAEAFM